jgi:hypothetical protein
MKEEAFDIFYVDLGQGGPLSCQMFERLADMV